MKKLPIIAALAIAALSPLALKAQSTSSAQTTSLKMQIGVTYLGGYSDITDIYEKYGYEFSFKNPIGINVLLRQDFENGLGWDFNLGPAIMIKVDDYYGDSATNYFLPLEADVRYTFFPNKDITPYVRGGLRYIYVSSDTWDSDGLGFGAAVGVEFNHTKSFSYGFELSVSTAEIKADAYDDDWDVVEEKAKPCKFCITAYLAF